MFSAEAARISDAYGKREPLGGDVQLPRANYLL
jgi:hypothetical protein